eukprot:Em0013g699a
MSAASHQSVAAVWSDATLLWFRKVEINVQSLEDKTLMMTFAAASVTVAQHAKDSFGMTKLHKDIIMHLMQCVQNDSFSDNAIVKELSSKTKELLVNVSSLAPNGGKITLDLLRARKLSPATETFLFSLAAAEGLVQM